MTKQEFEEFKEEVRSAPKEYLLKLKEYFEKEYRNELREIGKVADDKYLRSYKLLKADHLDFLVEFSKMLDIVNAELKRLEKLK